MIKVLFVCHGNICRSPMAEFLFKKFVKDKGVADKFLIESAATSCEELGNPVYPPVRAILSGLNIDCSIKRARRITEKDGAFDYLIGMDGANIRNMQNFFGKTAEGQIFKMLDFTDGAKGQDVADPWYTGDFNRALRDIEMGLNGFYDYLTKSGAIEKA